MQKADVTYQQCK